MKLVINTKKPQELINLLKEEINTLNVFHRHLNSLTPDGKENEAKRKWFFEDDYFYLLNEENKTDAGKDLKLYPEVKSQKLVFSFDNLAGSESYEMTNIFQDLIYFLLSQDFEELMEVEFFSVALRKE